MFSLIVAYDQNNGIGLNNTIPWHIKEDLMQFKAHTLNHRIVMGYKTFSGFSKPLKDRHTIVACSQKHVGEENELVSYCTDLVKFLEENKDSKEEIFICGGAKIYEICLPYCQKLYISKVKGNHEVDTYFPKIDFSSYKLIKTTKYEEFDLEEYEKDAR